MKIDYRKIGFEQLLQSARNKFGRNISILIRSDGSGRIVREEAGALHPYASSWNVIANFHDADDLIKQIGDNGLEE